MHPKLSQIFKNLPEVDPPENLSRNILIRIENLEARNKKRRAFFSYASLLFSFLAVTYNLSVFGQSIVQSEFWIILTLVFSDAAIVTENWKNFTFSLLETFPAFSTSAILLPLFILFLSAGFSLDSNSNNKARHA